MAYFHKNLKYHEDKIEKRKINKDDIEFLKDLQKELNTQDNCGNASPKFWSIKSRDDKVTASGYEDYSILYDEKECCEVSLDEIEEILYEYYEETKDEYDLKEYHLGVTIDNIDRKNNVLYFDYCDSPASITQEEKGFVFKDIYYDEFVDFLNDQGHNIELIDMKIDWKYEGFFLTQKDAEEHLKANAHHYSSDAHTYCKTALRSPRYEKLLKMLSEIDFEEN